MKNVFKKLICLLCALILSAACFACTASAGSGSGNAGAKARTALRSRR